MSTDSNEELPKLRSNADNLSQCLDALRLRIEQLENGAVVRNGLLKTETIRSETISCDPVTGIKKRTVITDRSACHRAVRLPPNPAQLDSLASSNEAAIPGEKDRLLGPAYQARIIAIDGAELAELEVELICGELVVIKVKPALCSLIHPGDTIVELNGELVEDKTVLTRQNGCVKLKLILSTIYTAPMNFCKILQSTITEKSNESSLYTLSLNKGDVVQVLSKDNDWIQARKVNDLSRAGFIVPSLKMEPVAMLCPYGRRTLAILGAPGVGRRTLKAMLLSQLPHRFSTVIPYTSRAPRQGEQEGREYVFETKERLREMIRDQSVIEWGEYDNQIYSTSVESGRVCVLDCAAQALQILYNGEFMPYVVVIAPPEYEELVQLCKLRGEKCKKSEEQLRNTCDQHRKLMESDYAKYFDLVLVNRNHDITFRRLLDALEALKNEPQWVPLNWLK